MLQIDLQFMDKLEQLGMIILSDGFTPVVFKITRDLESRYFSTTGIIPPFSECSQTPDQFIKHPKFKKDPEIR